MSFVLPLIMARTPSNAPSALAAFGGSFVNQARKSLQGQRIALRAESSDDAVGTARKIRMMSESLPLVDIRNVNFQHRTVERVQRVEDGDRRMCERCGIDHNASGGLACLVYPIDDFIFPIALVELQFEVTLRGNAPTCNLDVG